VLNFQSSYITICAKQEKSKAAVCFGAEICVPLPACLSSAGYKPVCVSGCWPSASIPCCARAASGLTTVTVKRGNTGVVLGLLAADERNGVMLSCCCRLQKFVCK